METSAQLRDELVRLSLQEFAARHPGLFLGVSVTEPDSELELAGFNTISNGDISKMRGQETTMVAHLAKRADANGFSFITVGRSSNNDIVIRVPGVSKCHVVFNDSVERLTVADARSTNGTTLNGRRIEPNQPEPVQVGDIVGLSDNVTLMLFGAREAHAWFHLNNRW